MTQTKAPSQRQLRVAEEIRHVLGRQFSEDNLFINGLKPAYTMITDVSISPDLSYATIFVRAIAPVDTMEQVTLLNNHKGVFRKEIGRKVKLRIVPDIVFRPDNRFEESTHMDDILNDPRVRADVDKYADGE
jgi:ribosome-binding factor A